MTEPMPLAIYAFGPGDPLEEFGGLRQTRYLRFYLSDLGVDSVVEEPQYFDRDYLSEFAAFYALSSRGYPNTCRRLHFFSIAVDRALLVKAAGGDPQSRDELQTAYLGFSVIRPLRGAPFGRTVLKWYPESVDGRPHRVTTPKRRYTSHLAGIELAVDGLAWQQQDTAVGACATVALWSVLHSSALDEWHSVPTTADITRFANRTASLGARTLPTNGLTIAQIREAIKEAGLEPVFFEGEIKTPAEPSFSQERFAVSCAALIRSGFPVLLFALTDSSDLHAVCVDGFRSSDVEAEADPDGVILTDGNVKYVYLHDDNLGPSVRFELVVGTWDHVDFVELIPSAPEPLAQREEARENPCATYGRLRPAYLVAAVPGDLRISPDALHKFAITIASTSAYFLEDTEPDEQADGGDDPADPPDVGTSTRFFYLTEYLGSELAGVLSGNPSALAHARLALTEDVAPMSRLLGVVRVGVDGQALADVLFDTSEGDGHIGAFCTVVFSSHFMQLLATAEAGGAWEYGPLIDATA